ncbi:MAG: rhodanese-like domain-containing protein [Candidatus Saccharimonadales bacterium]
MKFIIVTAIALLGIGGILLATATKPDTKSSVSNFASVEADVKGGARFFDVRTPSEYASGHFPSSQNLPLGSLQSGQLPSVAKDTKIYVQCQSGNRSKQATAILKRAGYTNIVDLGGISDIQRLGGKLKT